MHSHRNMVMRPPNAKRTISGRPHDDYIIRLNLRSLHWGTRTSSSQVSSDEYRKRDFRNGIAATLPRSMLDARVLLMAGKATTQPSSRADKIVAPRLNNGGICAIVLPCGFHGAVSWRRQLHDCADRAESGESLARSDCNLLRYDLVHRFWEPALGNSTFGVVQDAYLHAEPQRNTDSVVVVTDLPRWPC